MHNENSPQQAPGNVLLDQKMRALSTSIAFPPTPDLMQAVATSIRAGARTHKPVFFSFPRRGRLLIAMAAVVIIAIVVLSVTPAGKSIADGLGLPGIHLSFRGGVPKATIIPGNSLEGLGTPIKLEDADTLAPFTILLPDVDSSGSDSRT